MKFSHKYKKLSKPRLFTTIRNHDMYSAGDVVSMSEMGREFKGLCLLRVPSRFNEIPVELLRYDTDREDMDTSKMSKEQIIDFIMSLYKRSDPPMPTDIVFIYLFQQI